jgi:tRNA-dihydrouridine synthase
MRLVARRRGCPYAVTEAILDRTLLAGGKGLANAIDINDEDHPVAGQIMGSEPCEMAAAARILAEHGYDVIDLNFACPVKKVKNKARGGWMLADVERGEAILRTVREALPRQLLSLSIRRGFDDSAGSEDRFWQLCEEARELGFVALRVHGRTVEQKYAGRSRRPFLTGVKAAFPEWTIWGSGDVFEPEDVVDMLAETGVDGVWIARGAIGNPWIFRDAMALLERTARRHEGTLENSGFAEARRDELIAPPTVSEQREALEEHFGIAMQIHGESLAGRRMRKIGIKYARFHPAGASVKKRFIQVRSLADWQAVLAEFYAHDGPGVRPPRLAVDEVNDADCGIDVQPALSAAGRGDD